MKIYKVGGAVRDEIMGIKPSDSDWVVVGSTPKEMISLGYKQVGKDFPVFIHPETNEEYALARTEIKTGKGYSGFTVDFDSSVTLEQDLSRRDLTINSIAMDMKGNIIDPYNGVQDIKNKCLVHTSDAFFEDPLRSLRLIRFKTKFEDFSIHKKTLGALNKIKLSNELRYLKAERVYLELEKGFAISATRFLQNIIDFQLIEPWFTTLSRLPTKVSNDFDIAWCQISSMNNYKFAQTLLLRNTTKKTLDVWKAMDAYNSNDAVEVRANFYLKMTSSQYDQLFIKVLPYFEKSNLNHRSIYEKIKKVDFSYLSNIKNELIPHEKRLKIIKIIEQDE